MSQSPSPIPSNETERLATLAQFDIDYSSLQNNFKDLAHLAARIAGTEISLINIIDSLTLWTISRHGLDLEQTPRSESACQYTILSDSYYEIPDMSQDERFKQNFYVDGPAGLRYYLGVPLTTPGGINIGSLCVINPEPTTVSADKIELLKIVANEVVNRLTAIKTIDTLTYKLNAIQNVQKKVVNDIRNPVAGIIGLSDLITSENEQNSPSEILEYIKMIHKSSKSVLDITDDVMLEHKQDVLSDNDFNLFVLKEKLDFMYQRQAAAKGVDLLINITERTQFSPVIREKLLQICGKLVSNAIRFTSKGGTVVAELDLIPEATYNVVKIRVTDAAIDVDERTLINIMHKKRRTLLNTTGEKGYAEELPLIKEMVESLHGQLNIHANRGAGATFEIMLQQHYL